MVLVMVLAAVAGLLAAHFATPKPWETAPQSGSASTALRGSP